jgi:uncharacterized protein YndB with AHSA1/START domain
MTVISTFKDTDALTLTFVAEFEAPVERIWQVWEDPRQLERWWGPPTWPATFERHDFSVGGGSRYFMTGPDGEKSRGWFRFTAIDAPHRLEFDQGFAGDDGEPLTTMEPVRVAVTLDATDKGTRMVTDSAFRTIEQLEQLISRGMEEGMRLAMSQIDDVLAKG